MKRLAAALATLVLTLALAAPALANDFIQRPPVPSSKDRPKTTATAKKKSASKLTESSLSKKITKTTTPGAATSKDGRPKGSLQ